MFQIQYNCQAFIYLIAISVDFMQESLYKMIYIIVIGLATWLWVISSLVSRYRS